MLTNKAKYALRALALLAEEYGKGPVLISKIAQKEGIPKKFLELILLELKNNGILRSKKGKGGGYFLGKQPGSVSVGSVVRLMDGPLAPVPCVSETAYRPCDECKDEKTCGVRWIMKEVRDSIAGVLDQTSLADMTERSQQSKMRKQKASRRTA
jgi:Rrf2 family protein